MSKKACAWLAALGILLCFEARLVGGWLMVVTGIGEDLNPFVWLLGLVFVGLGSLGYFDPDSRDTVWELVGNLNNYVFLGLILVHLIIRGITESGFLFRDGIREAAVGVLCWVIGYSIMWTGWPGGDNEANKNQVLAAFKVEAFTTGVACVTIAFLFWPSLGDYEQVALVLSGTVFTLGALALPG